MPEFEVTWQMTGTIPVNAADDLDAKTVVEGMTDIQLVQFSKVDIAQVISTRSTA